MEAMIMKVGGLGYQPENKFGFSQNKPNEIAQNASSKDVFTMSQRLTIASQISYQKMMGAMPFESKVEPTKPEDLFDFEEIAKNVLSFVKGAILGAKADGADNDKLTNMFEQARKGVEQGIGEAVEELKDSELYTDEIEQGIEKSRELIFDGLDEFEQSIFNPDKKAPSDAVFNGQNFYQLDNGASFEIKTAEGDIIKLTYNSQFSSSEQLSYNKSEEGESLSYSSSQSSSQAYSFSVEGDLNEDEVAAINELMSDLQEVSNEFFNGSLDEAFEQAKNLNLDSPQLVAMSMNLQQTEVRASVREYQTTQPGREIAKQLEPINEGLKESYDKAKPLNIENQLTQLLTWLNQQQANKENLLDYSTSFFEQLNQKQQKES
ncbi:DUF5610 domain-containing protein [Pseudoalteromonas spongiae]|uniref:DUF5610 domain-containing protein n=1 Tax=Pseudoalteromonas spongiae TaxID=298657 RepID=UPI00110B8764|nr:DUF5610 domain-containing protein [Pseudoalteromonas spongiae]TMO81591.1 hypothetical protein CWC15_21015 [Pseudoalteromonas spongiae]